MPRKEGSVTRTFMFNGERIYVTGVDEADAIEKMGKRKAELEAGKREITGSMLVRDWIDEWLVTYKEPTVNARWYSDIKSICKNYIKPSIGKLQVKTVKPIQLAKILNTNVKSQSFNNKLYDILKQIFRKAYTNHLIAEDITVGLEKHAGTKDKARRSITDKERALLLRTLDGDLHNPRQHDIEKPHRGKLFCCIMLYAGLRPGEVAALMWKDVDFKSRLISVNKALKSDGIIRPETKTDAGMREVPISDHLYDILFPARKSPFSPVCVNSRGNTFNKRTITDMWNNVRRLMNIEMGCGMYKNQITVPALPDDFYLYNLRHTYCTDLQAAGVPINVARELMGHSSIEVTSKIYTHHSDVSIKDALDKMNKYQLSTNKPRKKLKSVKNMRVVPGVVPKAAGGQ